MAVDTSECTLQKGVNPIETLNHHSASMSVMDVSTSFEVCNSVLRTCLLDIPMDKTWQAKTFLAIILLFW